MTFTFGRIEETEQVSVNSDGKLIKKYMTRYLAENDDGTELTTDEVLDLIGILPGAPHYIWSQATCNDMKCNRLPTIAPHCKWHVDYQHATDAVVPDDDTDTDPELRRVNRSSSPAEQQIFIIADENGELIMDTAGTPVDGGLPVTDFMGSYVWERNETHTSTSFIQAGALSGYVNLTTFMDWPPETLMLTVTSKEKWEGAYHFWTFTYTMTGKRDGWQPNAVNAGLWQLGYSGERERIMEGDTETMEPQPLDINGHVIPVTLRPAACLFLQPKRYPRMEFADLGLPTS